MPVTIRKALRRLLLPENTAPEERYSGPMEVSAQALDLFQEKLDELARFVAEEARKTNYARITGLDIARGFSKWHEEKIRGKLKISVEAE